ncbi:hypothetical protein HYE82_36695 [Streptomyces sp. BR123]|uniref:hypothetical protein n=1 Tax=Streptomyces sp. BR123 TaxID=2749828 RepID=UPI0015C47728|nr:hypothetical protein [Streptomyces sp. BR123]NXY99812.1 hypothetical protein [Streptomyces sp. BR123]
MVLNVALGLVVAAVVFFVLRPAPDESVDVPKAAAPSPSVVDRPMIGLADAFPDQVADPAGGTYTKVGAVALKSCTEPDSVGPLLADYIAQGKGCVGEQVALYKDAKNNQFNLAVFTMKDPVDTVMLVTRLGSAPMDYQVGAQAPPPASGLKTLPPDSGMVQSFTGQGRAMVVGLGQWSDGATRDYQRLVERLTPLLNSVSDRVARYETSH